jgi:transposase
MRAVVLRRRGKTFSAIGDMLGRTASTVKQWNDRFKSEGFDGLRDRPGRGALSRLGREKEIEFRREIENRLLEKDSSKLIQRLQQVQELLLEKFGVEYSRSGTQGLMHRLGFSKLRPRPKHEKNLLAAMEDWKDREFPLF